MLLQSQFGFGLREAAHNLRICPTTLKRACRRHGIHRWPRRQGSAGDASRQESMNLDTDSVTSLGATDGDQPAAAAAVTASGAGSVSSLVFNLHCLCKRRCRLHVTTGSQDDVPLVMHRFVLFPRSRRWKPPAAAAAGTAAATSCNLIKLFHLFVHESQNKGCIFT